MATFTYKGSDWTYNEVIGADGRVWMDRNLGAPGVATSFNDSTNYGDLFQWGRLDDGHQTPTSATTTTKATTDTPVDGKFIINSAYPDYDWRVSQNNNLWQNGLNVPAPTGWHIPTKLEWSALVSADGIINRDTAFSSNLKLPVTGLRNSNGALSNQGSYGYYWSNSPNSTKSYYLVFNSDAISPDDSTYRAYGFSVRLIKDPIAPTVTTQSVSSIAQTIATGNGSVTADSGATITERGTVYSTSANPTTADHKDIATGTTGAFTTSITGLTLRTTYHVRAYAINSVGTSYGEDVSFTTIENNKVLSIIST